MGVATRLRGINLQLGTLASGSPTEQFSLNLRSIASRSSRRVSSPLERQASIAAVPFGRGIDKDRTTGVSSVSPITARRPVVPSSGALSKTTRDNLKTIGERLKDKFFTSKPVEVKYPE